MNVASPILSVIPSLDGPVLAALSGTNSPLSLAEVHARSGRGSKSGVRQVLLRMVDEGLVLGVPGGFVLNRQHVAAPAVTMLADLHGELTRRIRSTVDSWTSDVALVGLFGSAARRDGDAASDIDVLMVSDAADLDTLIDDLTVKIRSWTGNPAQVIGVSAAELRRLRRAKEPIVARWEQDLIVISGDRRALRGVA